MTACYVAEYAAPRKDGWQVKGSYKFESAHRAMSKRNLYDARIKLLETYGADAVSWTVTKTERAKKGGGAKWR